MLIASEKTSLPSICNKMKKYNNFSCNLEYLLVLDSYTPPIKILIKILEHSFSEFVFNQQNHFVYGLIEN